MARTAARPSLADAIAAHVTVRGPRCSVALLNMPDPADRDDLATAIADRAVTATAIAKALQSRGHQIAALSIQRHRRGECTCPR